MSVRPYSPRQSTDRQESHFLRWTLIAISGTATAGALAWNWFTTSLPVATWIGLAALFWQAATASSAKGSFLKATAIGAGALLLAFYWVPQALRDTYDLSNSVSWSLFTLFLLLEALSFGLLGLITYVAHQKGGLAAIWVGASAVAIEDFWPRVFPWKFAYTQQRFPQFIQLAELFGPAGVTFAIVTFAAALAFVLSDLGKGPTRRLSNNVKFLTAKTLLLVVVFFWGSIRIEHWQGVLQKAPNIRVALIQVDPSYNDSLEKMRTITRRLEGTFDLVCWPETTLDSYHLSLTDFTNEEITRKCMLPPRGNPHPTGGLGYTVLAGGNSHASGATEVEGPFYPTAFLVSPEERIIGRYFKRVLMPMGEFIPFQDVFPVLRRWIGLDEISKPGADPSPLHLSDGTRIGVLMCYEDMIPSAVRESTNAGAQLLVSLINGSAFENGLALNQHLQLASLRAIENRRALVRCAATGVTCVVLPTGEISRRLPIQKEGCLIEEVPKLDDATFYQKGGYFFSNVCLVVALVVAFYFVIRRCLSSYFRLAISPYR